MDFGNVWILERDRDILNQILRKKDILKKKILIVGGSGFIGYHLAKKCLDHKWDVTSLSSRKPNKIRKLKKLIIEFAIYQNLK